MRRSLVFCALLFVAPARGAELVRPQAAPVQMTLSFAAPPAMPVLSPAALALPAPAFAAPLPQSAAPTPRKDDGSDGRSQLQRLAQSGDASGQAFDAPRRAAKMDYDEFGRQLAALPGLDLSPFRHADEKRRILAASGYTHLFAAGGRRVPLADAADVRIGKAFLSVKRAFDRRPR